MRPYPGRMLPMSCKVFNYRLSRCRRMIENAFGILSATWRILNRRIDLEPEKAKLIVLACCTMHNMLREGRTPPEGYRIQQLVSETEHHGGLAPLPAAGIRASNNAIAIRDSFSHYVNRIAPLPWQEQGL